ncbi:LysR family transcriptional regulator [Mesorhizobium sp. USDA-HM6]|nr:LysR family transcriptional regulator [Mesorhizobium sp. USDA-HM6]
MRFKGLDLNLLVALNALLTARNLTAAARSINLSQPAMSAAIARLRAYFGDDLFIMKGRELVLTPRAEGLAVPVREVLLQVQLSIIHWDEFNPAQSDRRFRIVLSDFMILVFLQKIVDRIAREAPGVSFELLAVADDPPELLRRGDIDFLIMPELFMLSAHPKAALFDDKLVCVGCCTNKEPSRQLTFERYMEMGHVAVTFGLTRVPAIDEWLLRGQGFNRRIEVVVQAFSMIPPVLSGTDRIAIMPLRLVEHFAKTIPLRIFDLWLPVSTFTEAVQWPALHNSDPASIWMRKIMLEEASRMTPLKSTGRSDLCE